MRRLAILIAAAALPLQCGAALAQASSLNQARAARSAGRTDEAERLLRVALRAQPNNYLALYNMGLIYEARAVSAPPGPQRLEHYRTAARWLERAFRSPGRAGAGADRYTILNSLGAVYLGLADLSRADFYLQQGRNDAGQFDAPSRGRLYGNLGYLYALQGDTGMARQFFAQGARLGNAFSRENLSRLDRAGIR